VAYDRFRPNSPEYWQERRRQWEIQQAQRRRWRRIAVAVFGGIAVVLLLIYASTLVPDNVGGRFKDAGRELMRR